MLRLKRVVREPAPRRCRSRRAAGSSAGRPRWWAATSRSAPSGTCPSATCPAGCTSPRTSGRLGRPTAAGPLLVFFHGGGWMYGDLDSHDAACRFLAERSGVRVLAVDYRLAPEHPFPAAYDDALEAYRWVVKNAESIGADPERLGVGGDSAGGNLAATTAIAAAEEGLPLAFQLLIYPGTDMRGGQREPRAVLGRLLPDQEVHGPRPRVLHRGPGAVQRPARLPAVRRHPARPRAGVRRHRGLRPAPRRGRGLRPPAGRRGGAGRAGAVPRPDPRLLQRGRGRPDGARRHARRSPPSCARRWARHRRVSRRGPGRRPGGSPRRRRTLRRS